MVTVRQPLFPDLQPSTHLLRREGTVLDRIEATAIRGRMRTQLSLEMSLNCVLRLLSLLPLVSYDDTPLHAELYSTVLTVLSGLLWVFWITKHHPSILHI